MLNRMEIGGLLKRDYAQK
jgi:hypothetical protein